MTAVFKLKASTETSYFPTKNSCHCAVVHSLAIHVSGYWLLQWWNGGENSIFIINPKQSFYLVKKRWQI